MNRKIIKLIAVISLFAMIIVTSAGCAAKKSSYSVKNSSSESIVWSNDAESVKQDISYGRDDLSATAGGSESAESYTDSGKNESYSDQKTATALTGSGTSNSSSINTIIDQRKIIRNANISIEVENFDKAYGMIEYIISDIGYVQETKISTRKHYVDSKEVLVPSGVIVIRVDAEKFNIVLKDLKGLGTTLDENIKTEDVTDKFFDIDSRLRLLKYEQNRLEEYLNKITDPDTIFKTESRLTDIRHEIEGLTGTLNKLGNLVKLSTITINMNEKIPETQEKVIKKESYWSKLSHNFFESLQGVINLCADLLIFLAAAFPVLVFLGIITLLIVLAYRKFFKNKIKLILTKSKNTET